LPKLIIVALLLNFSLVFIGILVDISRILYNTIFAGNENLITDFINVLGLDISNVLTQLAGWLVTLAGAWVIPVVGPFSQLAFTILLLTGYFPNILTWIFQMILSFMTSAVFFLYIFLFAARVFVIQLLAIISPFAFVCMILPQTQKWWDEWLRHLLQWTFLGIVLLFFLVIGTRAANELVPPGGLGMSAGGWLDWLSISSIFVYYFFVFIYLILVGYVSNRFMPVLAGFIISQATAWGQRAYRTGIKPFGVMIKKTGESVYKEKIEPKARPWLEKRPVIGKAIGGPGAYEAELKKRTAVEKKRLEGRSTEDLQKIVETRPVTMADRHRRAAAMEILAEKRRLKDEYKNYLAEVKSYGGDTGEILKARPDWAPELNKTPGEIIEKMEPAEFRRKVQSEALESPEVFINMDVKQLREIERRGTTAQKDAIRTLLATKKAEINKLRRELKAQGKMVEYRRALETINEAIKFPAFYEKPKARKAKPSSPIPPYVV
jgi:hypothetical protein